MKKLINNLGLALFLPAAIFFMSCEDETDNLSKVTTYADITLTGGEIYTIELGSATTYTDPGATAKNAEGGAVEVKTTRNTVDVTKLGSYVVEYEAVNAEGFVSTNTRVVNVIKKPIHSSIAGNYIREANGRTVTVTQLGEGFYVLSDAWGSATSGGAPLLIPAQLLNFQDDSVLIVPSPAPFGDGFITGKGIILPNGDLSLETDLGGVAQRVNPWKKQ